MSKGTIKRIHVNRHVIKSNTAKDESNSVFTVKNRGRTIIADSVEIKGPSKLVYAPNDPLSCGAKVWIHTLSPVVLTFPDATTQEII